jgi:hypothetical protein
MANLAKFNDTISCSPMFQVQRGWWYQALATKVIQIFTFSQRGQGIRGHPPVHRFAGSVCYHFLALESFMFDLFEFPKSLRLPSRWNNALVKRL